MLLIPTMMPIGEDGALTEFTVDADKIMGYTNGGKNLTGLLLDGGISITIAHDYKKFMKLVVDEAKKQEI